MLFKALPLSFIELDLSDKLQERVCPAPVFTPTPSLSLPCMLSSALSLSLPSSVQSVTSQPPRSELSPSLF